MADRALVFEGAQIRTEATYGVDPASGTKLLTAMNIALSPAAEVDVYGPMGQKFDSLSILNREWAEADITGRPTFTEIVYPLSSVLTTAVITTPGGGTTSRDWDFMPSNTTADTPSSFTVETGQAGAGNADKVTGLRVNELTLTFSRADGVEMTGTAIARAVATGQTLTGSPTTIALVPIAPGMVSVYVDDTAAAIGTTKLLRDFTAELAITDRYSPVWPLNGALSSFDALVETKPTMTLNLTLGNDTVGQGFLTTMRTGARKYIRIEAVGSVIEAALTYLLRIDCCAIVADGPSKSDVEGLSTLDWSFRLAHDTTIGSALTVKVRNTLTAL